jgi:hypothetical protein
MAISRSMVFPICELSMLAAFRMFLATSLPLPSIWQVIFHEVLSVCWPHFHRCRRRLLIQYLRKPEVDCVRSHKSMTTWCLSKISLSSGLLVLLCMWLFLRTSSWWLCGSLQRHIPYQDKLINELNKQNSSEQPGSRPERRDSEPTTWCYHKSWYQLRIWKLNVNVTCIVRVLRSPATMCKCFASTVLIKYNMGNE